MLLRQSERLRRRRSSLMRDNATDDDNDITLAMKPSLKRRSQTAMGDVTDTAANFESKYKATKFQLLYNMNLFKSNFYDIFQLKRNGNDKYQSFKRALTDSYDLLKRTYTTQLSLPGVNDYKKILTVADFGYTVLADHTYKNLYDQYLEFKDGDTHRAIVKRQREFNVAVRDVNDQMTTVLTIVDNIVSNNIYAALLHNYFTDKMNSDIQLRPSSFNRILVTWTVHPNNTNNENITLEVIENYFKFYGSVNGAVMCTGRSNCALLEFSSSSGVTAAINEKNKIYQITELNKWQINSATKSALKDIFQRVLDVESRAREAHSILVDENII
ncbi:hypothetical protein [Orgyia leucostigma nucleopolyhedrovirus]|uniref:RRM domain-containing protein n=1 Tax=Orgyia leucostigma nucleopolyhedrovirus TaxID=490711 RepID=B0FDR2_9ABAC|nr:hypothetical protein [Orgyia leucostigma nucleopolyhedrovirus]ABY65770.1 hypothetical protein [Orgyia leucostigma nucleopolyhedrovirus]